jgi:hypothetical protein
MKGLVENLDGDFDFDAQGLEPLEKVVKFKGVKYILREASHDTAREFRNMNLRATHLTVDEDKSRSARFDGLANSQHFLVSRCLFVASPEGRTHLLPNGDVDPTFRVNPQSLLNWPNRVVEPLYDWIRKVSKLDDDEDDSLSVDALEKKVRKLQERIAKKNKEASISKGEMTDPNPTTDILSPSE